MHAELLSAALVVAARPSSSSSSAAMGIPATIIGGVWGVSVVCGVNALRQVRFFKSAPPHPPRCPTAARPARVAGPPAARRPAARRPPAHGARAPPSPQSPGST